MGIWFRQPNNAVGESVRYKAPANIDRKFRSIGGMIYVTSQRVIFMTNHLDHWAGGKDVEILLTNVKDVASLAPSGTDKIALVKPVNIRHDGGDLVVRVRSAAKLCAAVEAGPRT